MQNIRDRFETALYPETESIPMARFPLSGCVGLALLAMSFSLRAQSMAKVDDRDARIQSLHEELQCVHEQAQSPEELIALKAEILDRYPQPVPEAQLPVEPMPTLPPEHLDASGALVYEMSQVLNEIAKAAKSLILVDTPSGWKIDALEIDDVRS